MIFKGAIPEEPNYVLTRLGLIASGGQVPAVISGSLSALRVDSYEDAARECSELKREVSALKETVREYERQEEILLPSLNDELAKNLLNPRLRLQMAVMKCQYPLNRTFLKYYLIITKAP